MSGYIISVRSVDIKDRKREVPEKPEPVDLNNGIPVEAKRFGITPSGITLLRKYGLHASYIPEWQNRGYGSNMRIEITNNNGNIDYLDRTGKKTSRIESIDLTSDIKNNPVFTQVHIGEETVNGNEVLNIKIGNMFQIFDHYIPIPVKDNH